MKFFLFFTFFRASRVKFCVKLGKTATETLQLLRDAYGDEALKKKL
jgi:hypothetical protein